ncbi:hypothetical protein E2C01_067199 [Portunus trituberculatus]|uniref:Uncharacterized protein n=1 Tax=Portunus trituberculatus TaxID=210409 RepID=A0A5B7HSZ9_PORTR|nr:hypothetical protein [Portunus trituberculatus]
MLETFLSLTNLPSSLCNSLSLPPPLYRHICQLGVITIPCRQLSSSTTSSSRRRSSGHRGASGHASGEVAAEGNHRPSRPPDDRSPATPQTL